MPYPPVASWCRPSTTAATRMLLLVVVLLLAAALLTACDGGTDTASDADTDDAPTTSPTTAPDADEGAEEARGPVLDGPDPDAVLGAAALAELTFTVTDPNGVDDVVVLLERPDTPGAPEDVTDEADRDGDTLRYRPSDLADGWHEVLIARTEATTAAPAPDPDEVLGSWRFEVKAAPPPLELTSPDGPIIGSMATEISGTSEPEATITVGDTDTTTAADGSFTLSVTDLPADHEVVATDRAGNVTTVQRSLAWVPSRVEVDELRTVHVSFNAWSDPEIREPLLALIDDGTLTAIQLDLKDESGQVGFDSGVALADEAGATRQALDLAAVVADLHARDVAVVGRIVAFADPVLSPWAWEHDRRDWVIQLTDGSDLYRGSYAGFTNFTHPEVIAYNLDIAEAAAAVGVDHILWDYIRRPEGMSRYVVPGLETTPEEAIVEFTRQADERLAPYGVQHGASVYGIAADRPWEIGQDIRGMAPYLDYVAPMIYPSHWGEGEYGVADPNRQPYDIIRATLAVWQDTVAGSRARVVPWLEDTPYRAWDRPVQVREQWRGTRDAGLDEWLMWNAASRYSLGVYEPW